MQKNSADTEAYTVFDHLFLKAMRSVSHVVSVKKLTQPFWNRWRASEVGDDLLFRFLNSIQSIDDWPAAAQRMHENESLAFESERGQLTAQHQIERLRNLSYMCNLGHWGILPINSVKREVYTHCRDYYIEAEKQAWADRYRRIAIDWSGKTFKGNLHLPVSSSKQAPLIIIVHGIDACKEEHLATELSLMQGGFAVLGFDGPGQGEAFLLDGILWSKHFHQLIAACLESILPTDHIDTSNVGLVGLSIGSLWAMTAASGDPRIRAIYDLGAPINTKAFARVPFIIKSKMCQITGARTNSEIQTALSLNFIDKIDILSGIIAAVRIVHGTKDRVVSMDDKVWLKDQLDAIGASRHVSMRIFEGGDHCCTSHIPDIRKDMAEFFTAQLL